MKGLERILQLQETDSSIDRLLARIEELEAGEKVLLIDQRDRTYLVSLEAGASAVGLVCIRIFFNRLWSLLRQWFAAMMGIWRRWNF